jgi:hypothetical protein
MLSRDFIRIATMLGQPIVHSITLTAHLLSTNRFQVFATLLDNPIPISDNWTAKAEIFILDDLIGFIFSALYTPYKSWPLLSQILSDLIAGGELAIDAARKILTSPRMSCTEFSCSGNRLDPSCILNQDVLLREVGATVSCTDMPFSSNWTIPSFRSWLAALKTQSPTFAAVFATTSRLDCAGWAIRPKWRHVGPFGRKTKNSILFIAKSHDPIASVAGAADMAEKYAGARGAFFIGRA